MKQLAPYSMGIGDRFGQQGTAQLESFLLLTQQEAMSILLLWKTLIRSTTQICLK